jgi:serine/threonine-protein kinase RsbW
VHLDVAVCLPRESETVSLLRTVVTDALRTLGVTEDCIDDVRLALSEAATNVIQHAGDDDEYEVRIEVADERCSISVTNPGSDLDADALTGVLPDEDSSSGRGVAIMQAVMDHVAFSSEPEAGTIVHLVKTRTFDPDSAVERLRRSRDQRG